jgi:hypothetical protein
MNSSNRLIITAASEIYASSLLALLGSLNLNWPGHPVLVYDIGLEPATLRRLEENGIPVKKVPPFCPHWRQHYTWKIWCLNDAPAQDILWMDSAMAVLRPVDEIWDAVDRLGYFLVPNYEMLDWEASVAACEGCGVSADFRNGKPTLAATMMGFRKTGKILQLLQEALTIAQEEKYIKGTDIAHRHDQAILSLLMYKHLSSVVLADGTIYLGGLLPNQTPGQKIWAHRRRMLERDITHFAAHISVAGEPFLPSAPYSLRRARSRAHLYSMYWNFGRGDRAAARENAEMAFSADPSIKDDMLLIAAGLQIFSKKLQGFFNDGTDGGFLPWAVEQCRLLHGEPYTNKLKSILSAIPPEKLTQAVFR